MGAAKWDNSFSDTSGSILGSSQYNSIDFYCTTYPGLPRPGPLSPGYPQSSRPQTARWRGNSCPILEIHLLAQSRTTRPAHPSRTNPGSQDYAFIVNMIGEFI